jgi:hypothetical protein
VHARAVVYAGKTGDALRGECVVVNTPHDNLVEIAGFSGQAILIYPSLGAGRRPSAAA